ncbi:MAG: amidohydrolase [Clostridiales bacterium]|nr:amidohydrolase [Clostridiales bacterium]
MLFSGIDILDENLNHLKSQYVGVVEDKIEYIGSEKPEKSYGEEYDGTGKLLMAGLYNAHTHSPMNLLRGYAENLTLHDWLHEKVFPFEAKLTGDDIYNGTMLAVAEMLRFGTVSFTDMYYMGEEIYRAVAESGIKCNFSYGVTCFDDSAYSDLRVYKESQKLIENCHNAENGRFKVDLSIHGEYTSTPRVVAAVAEHAARENVNIHIHLSESQDEQEGCKERNGKTPARYFYDLGVFGMPTTAAHCVWLEDDDFDILRENGVTVAACPVSNLKLASGFSRVDKMIRGGMKVAIGTDSAASNNNLNLFKDIHLFSILYKCTSGNPAVITPKQALTAATTVGASAQGRQDSGMLKVGAKADLIVLDISLPHMMPVHDMLNNLVFATQGSDVCLTMVDGKVLYKDGVYLSLDIERVVYNAQKSTQIILAML